MSTTSSSFSSNFPFTTSPKPTPSLSHYHPPHFSHKFHHPFFTTHLKPYSLKTQHPLKCNKDRNFDQNPPIKPPPNTQQHQIKETQEAISSYIQGVGVSVEESNFISLNCPRYGKLLIDGVRDLEEWNKWNGGGEEGFGDLGFKEKVVYLAKERGDGGKVAFLESFVGLSLPSAFIVARYLSGESLPGLILKVKYMKEMLFASSDDNKALIGKSARRMLTHLSIQVDDDLQQALSFFQKVEAKRGGLDTLGASDESFRYLVESFPSILSLQIDSHLKVLVQFLEIIGVPKERMGGVFLLFPPIILLDITTIKRKILTLDKVRAADKYLGKMLLKYPWILSKSIQDNYKEILSFFDMEKVPRESVYKAIQSMPLLLGCSVSNLKTMVGQLSELGVENQKLGQVVARSPQLLLRKPEELVQVVTFLEDLGVNKENLTEILSRCPEIFATSIEKTLKKKLNFLISNIGVAEEHLPRVIKKYPEVLVSDIDRTIIPRMEYLMEVGLTKKEISFMVRRFSPLLGYSIDKVLRPKYEFLVHTMEKPVKDVVSYPRYFSYSLEKKIKPRYWVLKGRNVECSLKDMLDKNDEEFAAEFMDDGNSLVPPSPHE